MKKLLFSLLAIALLVAPQAQAKNKDKNKTIDWNQVDFVKDYKIKAKIPGSVGKSLSKNPTFISDFYLTQASLMKGSSKAGTLQKQGVGSVFSEVELGGISKEALQNLVEELYQEFTNELKSAGLNIVDGKQLIETSYAQSKKDDKNSMVGQADGNAIFDKVSFTTGSDIREQYIFRPEGKIVYTTWKKIPANFYQRLSSKESTNLISIGYTVRFAAFNGQHVGLSKNRLETHAALSITPSIMIVNPKGSFSWITVGENIWGNSGWAEGLVKTSSRDGSFVGLSSSADYAVAANQDQYIAELKSIVSNLQKSIVSVLKENM